MASNAAIFVVGVAVVGGIYWFNQPGFTDEDVEKTKADIRAEWEKRPNTQVSEVVMEKKNAKELIGYVKLKFNGDDDLMKSCTATMTEGSRYLWECK